mgnify:CR=1 FL=1
MSNTLVVAPHPDDEVLGCGGIMKKLSDAGNNVFVLVVTRGKKELYSDERIINVRNEAKRAHSILGVAETRFLEYPAPDLDRVSLAEIASSIMQAIRDYQIEFLYLPHGGDIHHDHKVVFNAGLVASRPVGKHNVKGVFSYETLSETEWAAPISSDAFIPTLYCSIVDTFNAKAEALKCYQSQLREFPASRSLKAIEALANYRGSTIGVTHAEAFMTIRIIEL